MNYYTVYKTQTGIIEHIITTNADINECPVQNNETIVEGEFSASKYKFVDGQPIEQEITINQLPEDL